MMNQVIKTWYDEHGQEVKDWSRDLWEHPEVAMEEFHACEVTAAFMKKYGFSVETFHCKDRSLPGNTVVATWGSGKPVIGIIGEYDALPGIGQEVAPYRAPKEGNGHGCGHSLMAPSCGSAAIALKAAMEAEGLSGTIKFFACPAEETVEGKAYMAKENVFDGLDCCLAWHPQPRPLQLRETWQTALCNLKVEFFGTSSHAASTPEKGRSALDACELMNVAVNYLREHVDPSTRMHYSYLAGGDKPNVVPNYAALHYFLRTRDLKSNYDLLERVKKCAQGAAMMTETEYKITINAHTPGCVQIVDFNRFFYEATAKIPALTYTEEEMAFGTELFRNVNGREPEEGEEVVFTSIVAPAGVPVYAASSTDAGHVSRLTPTSRLYGWGCIKGVPGHSWGEVACVGHEIGLKAAVYTGMAQAQCAYEIMKNPELLKPWRAEWEKLVAAEAGLVPMVPGQEVR